MVVDLSSLNPDCISIFWLIGTGIIGCKESLRIARIHTACMILLYIITHNFHFWSKLSVNTFHGLMVITVVIFSESLNLQIAIKLLLSRRSYASRLLTNNSFSKWNGNWLPLLQMSGYFSEVNFEWIKASK